MKTFRRLIPLFLSLFVIFALTFQNSNASAALTIRLQELFNSVFDPAGSASHWWHNFKSMRRFAHLIEYFPLGIFAFLLFRGNMLPRFVKSFILCAAVSLSDQIVKNYLPGREFDRIDLLFDLAGYSAGILLTALFIALWKRIRLSDADGADSR